MFFTVTNSGNSRDDFRLKEKRKKLLKVRYFLLTGGRKNVTSSLRRGTVAVEDVNPEGLVVFLAQAKYRSEDKAKKTNVRITGISSYSAEAIDAVKVRVQPES